MILIVAALKAELLPLIQYFRIEQKEIVAQGTLYHSEKLHLLRTGVGMQNAREVFSEYLKKYDPDKIINLGTAGTLNQKFSVGMIVEAGCIQNEQSEKIYPMRMQLEEQLFENVYLLTVKDAVLNQQRKERLFIQFNSDIVDMEAFVLASVALQHRINFYCIKIISDQADENAINQFKDNYKSLLDKFSTHVIDYLNTIL